MGGNKSSEKGVELWTGLGCGKEKIRDRGGKERERGDRMSDI